MAISAKDFFESAEKVGWLGVVALGIILLGLFLLHGSGLFTLDAKVWSPDRQTGLALIFIGILVLIAALASNSSRLKEFNATADERAALRSQVDTLNVQLRELQIDKSQMEGRRAAYRQAWNIIRGHKALSFLDNPEFIRKVLGSAATLHDQLTKLLSDGKLDDHSQEFIATIRQFAKDFTIGCEDLERRGILPSIHQNPEPRLSMLPDGGSQAIEHYRRWTDRTKALLIGAASTLGEPLPKFDW